VRGPDFRAENSLRRVTEPQRPMRVSRWFWVTRPRATDQRPPQVRGRCKPGWLQRRHRRSHQVSVEPFAPEYEPVIGRGRSLPLERTLPAIGERRNESNNWLNAGHFQSRLDPRIGLGRLMRGGRRILRIAFFFCDRTKSGRTCSDSSSPGRFDRGSCDFIGPLAVSQRAPCAGW